MSNKCTYCHEKIPEGTEVYLDESEVDGAFCSEDHAEAFILHAVETVDNEPDTL